MNGHNPQPYQGQQMGYFQPGPSSSSSSPAANHENSEKWGTHIMGVPAVPTCHPNNQKAALWGAGDQYQYQNHHQPYLQYAPVDRTNTSPLESVLHRFNSWSSKAGTTANNIWRNRMYLSTCLSGFSVKTAPSMSEAAWAKANLTAKAISEGGFESLYKQTFQTFPNEKLKKTFACYLSTTTGPVAGTLYLSNVHLAFCSDRPLSFTAPSGLQTWSYYKVMIPLGKISTVNPVIMREKQTERYLQAVTIDNQDFWFMGFVNYEKASHHLHESVSSFAASGIPVQVQPTIA